MRKTQNNNKQSKEAVKKPLQYTYQFKVARSDFLLDFLLSKIDNSRNAIKGLLSSNKVLVNGTVIRQFNYPLAKDDEVKIAKNSVNETKAVRGELKTKTNLFKSWIIYEDDELIAINKPHGLLSVESDKERESAYTYVLEYLKEKDPKSRPYQLHRIDKETSGVLVFAKDIKIHSMLKMHWNEDVTMREYIAVVKGQLETKKDTIVSYLMENQNNLVYSTKNPKGKKAITHYEVINESKENSLLKVLIDTGRKNQIRVHMKDLGHPILGDDKYGNYKEEADRLYLHASRLDFYNPIKKKNMSFIAPLPKEFKELFK